MTGKEIDQKVLAVLAEGAKTRRDVQEGAWRWLPGRSDDARRVALNRALNRLEAEGEVTRVKNHKEYTYTLTPSGELRAANFHEGPELVQVDEELVNMVLMKPPPPVTVVRDKVGPAERYRFVQERLARMNPSELAADVAARFGVTVKTGWEDIKEVRRSWKEQDKDLAPALRADMMERLFLVYARALETNDFKSSVTALKQICKITGLEETTVRTILGADEGVSHLLEALALTPAQRASRIAELEAKAYVEPTGPSHDLLMTIAMRVAELRFAEYDSPGEDGQPSLNSLLRQAGVLE